MIGLQHFGDDAFRRFDAIIIGKAGHGQGFFDRRAPPAGAPVNALEGEIAADHHQAAALRRPVADQLQPVRHRLAMEPHIGRQQQGVGPDIRDDEGGIFG